MQLREKRDCKTGARFVAESNDLLPFEIDVIPIERRGFRPSQTGEADKFHEIRTVLRVCVEHLLSDLLNDRSKFVPSWRQPQRPFAFQVFEMCCGIVRQHSIASSKSKNVPQQLQICIVV